MISVTFAGSLRSSCSHSPTGVAPPKFPAPAGHGTTPRGYGSHTSASRTADTWPLAPDLAVLLALALMAGLLEGAMMPAKLTARQRYSPLDLQGGVSTTGASLRLGVMALGQAAGGLLVPQGGTRVALIIVATGLVGAAGLASVSRGSRSASASAAGRG